MIVGFLIFRIGYVLYVVEKLLTVFDLLLARVSGVQNTVYSVSDRGIILTLLSN